MTSPQRYELKTPLFISTQISKKYVQFGYRLAIQIMRQ